MSYPFYSHPPSLPSPCAPPDNSNYPIPATLAPSAACVSASPSSPCSTRAASGTTLTWVRRRGGRPYWISSGWVRLRDPVCVALIEFTRPRYRVHTIPDTTSLARSSHHRAFRRRHDTRIRNHVCAGGDKGGHPRNARPNTRCQHSHLHRSTHADNDVRRRLGSRARFSFFSARSACATPSIASARGHASTEWCRCSGRPPRVITRATCAQDTNRGATGPICE